MSSKMLHNLESVSEMIGALQGMTQGIEEDSYIEDIIKRAHDKTSHNFDLAAAATARAGHLQHVFEFGTAGVTPGRVAFPDPTSQAARLWKHQIAGTGGNQEISYTFRPAIGRNPQPTTKSTGVPSKYVRRLSKRKYVFWNKAFVMETGQSVEIHAKNGNYLFVPFYGAPSQNPRNTRGYMMWNSASLGPLKVTPGKKTQGTFTAFWLKWWSSAGGELIEQDMRKSISDDIERAQAKMKTSNSKMKPARASKVSEAFSRAAKKAKASFGRGRL